MHRHSVKYSVGGVVVAQILREIFCGGFVVAQTLREIFCGGFVVAQTLREIFCGEFVVAQTLREIFCGGLWLHRHSVKYSVGGLWLHRHSVKYSVGGLWLHRHSVEYSVGGLWLHRHSVILKTATIGVYSLMPLFLPGHSNINVVVLNKTFLLLFQMFLFVCLFVCFCISWLSSGGEVEDYIKCELSGGGSPRHLNSFSNLSIVAVHYTHINTCYVLLLWVTVPMYTMLSTTIIRTYNIWLPLLTALHIKSTTASLRTW